VNPAARLSLALVVGLALSSPTLRACVRGDADVLTAAMRYLVAFVLSWVSIAGVARLFEAYASVGLHDAAEAVDDTPRRRADDEPSTAGAQ